MKKATFIFLLVLSAYILEAQTVYIGGSYNKSTGLTEARDIACYWVNGTFHEIDGISVDVITAKNGIVYAAGKYNENTFCYWVDGKPNILPDCKEVKQIIVENGNVYILGVNNNKTDYWINGIRYSGPSDGEIRNITIVNNIIYAAGYYTEKARNFACYWINGVRQELSNSDGYFTTGIEVINNNIYIGGMTHNQACYWINSVQHTITNLKDLLNEAFKVYNGNVYMIGMRYYYINNTPYEITIPGYHHNASFRQRYTVVFGKIIIAGGIFERRNIVPVYWIDGIRNNISGYEGIAHFKCIYASE
jgi:hypothetical protein